jgi:hypothetical protein
MPHTFNITVQRVNESANKDPEFSLKAVAVSVDAEGNLHITSESGAQVLGATTWGSFQVERVFRRSAT